MAQEEEAREVPEEAGGAKPRIQKSKLALLVVVPSIVVGVIVLSLIAGEVYCLRKTSALQAEITHLRKEQKDRAKVEEELREQVVALASSLNKHIGPEGGKEKKELSEDAVREIAKDVAREAAKDLIKEAVAKEVKAALPDARPEPAIPPKSKRSAADGFSCDITGKSAEEQAAILKRCVGAMEAPPKMRAGAK